MRKIISVLLCAVLVAAVFAGCSAKVNTNEQSEKKISVVTTIFPVYDWVMNILGDKADNAEVTLLLDSGTDLHSYQPTADDMIKISNCDVFIYVGGESDEWVDDALENTTNKDRKVVNLMDSLGTGAKEEELVEGMQGEEEEETEGEEEGEEEGPEYDEHIWLSLKNAITLTDAIAKSIGEADPENKSVYTDNTKAYATKLGELDAQYQQAVDSAENKVLLFGDRFPFRYMVDDYDLSYYAAFIGCSAETEASFETVTFLAGKVDELGLKHVMVIESSDGKIAETIIQNTKSKSADVLKFDSMQSTTSAQIKEGTTYLSVMKNNLKVLKTALS